MNRYVAYVKSLLAEDRVGAAKAADQIFAAESINSTSDGAIHAKTLLANSARRQGNFKDAGRHYEELIDAAKKSDTALDLETWDDATTAFEKSGMSESMVIAQAIADELRRGALSLKAPVV